jgi:hypothetical protein
MVIGSLAERPIYSCRAHIATSFVLSTRVTRREVFRGDLEILERMRQSDLVPTSFNLVVLSSCIEVDFQFLGRVCTESRIGGFMGVGPLVRGNPEICVHECATYYPDSRAWVRP